jgi:hypothetical protein
MSANRSLRSAALAALSALFLAACNDATITEPPVPVASVVVTASAQFVLVGEQVTFQAAPTALDGRILDRPVSWESEDEAIATVSSTGVVTTLTAGEVAIKAISEGKVGRLSIRILPLPPVPVAEVRLSEDNVITLEWNGFKAITARALDAQGNTLQGRPATWLSSRPEVVTVENGLITAVGTGNAMISASIEGVHAMIGVIVRMPPVVEITIDGPTGLEVGELATFGTRVRRAAGPVLYEPATWTSSAPAIAEVTNVDVCCTTVKVHSTGVVTLTATKEGVSTSVTLRATPQPSHDLIYNRVTGTASELFTLDLAFIGRAPVKINAGNVSSDPSPSPDGTQFVFAVAQLDAFGQPQNDLFIVNRNGLNMRWLTRTVGVEHQPEWSPDGTKILFRSSDGRQDIYTINPDGTGLTNVTAALPASMDKRDPSWSPDSRRIAFIGSNGSEYNVWTIRADGTNALQITMDMAFDQFPAWSPDGQQIAFTRYDAANPANGDDVMIVSSGGGSPTRLSLPGAQRTPAWSPDGHYIAVSGSGAGNGGAMEIYTLRPDGTGLRLRTLAPAWGGGLNPAWIKRP